MTFVHEIKGTPQVVIDHNAPPPTLAAMHVMNDTADPFYTSLQAGARDSKKIEEFLLRRGKDFGLYNCVGSLHWKKV